MNRLFCGDNLEVLRKEIQSDSIDLVYLDPPFNSDQNFNVFYTDEKGRKSDAQRRVFLDTWEWNQTAKNAYQETVEHGGSLAEALRALYAFLETSPLMAYLSMMAPRLRELHRVLRSSGSLYLHCDPNASHYLKMLLDAIFGPAHFRNELIWKRTSSHNDARRFADVHDTILYYARSKQATWNPQHLPHGERYLKTHYNRRDESGRVYRLDNIIRSESMGPRPNLAYEYGGFRPPWGWRVEPSKLKAIDKAGRLAWVKGRKGPRVPYLIRFLDEQQGSAMPSVWDDIPPVNSQAQERMGYPTQKPEALLERIIQASSDEGQTVLDPFCGCGTAVAVAQKLNRRWVGIDITKLAISVIRGRLHNQGVDSGYVAKWLPAGLDEAAALAEEDPFEFQCWVLGELGINPLYQRKGADRGVDGRLFFFDGPDTGRPKQIVFSVKGGNLSPVYVRELAGVMRRDRAQIGVLVTLNEPTQAMRKEAATVDHFRSHDDSLYPGVQLLTVQEIFDGKRVQHPNSRTMTFPDAKMAKAGLSAVAEQQSLKFA